MSLGLERQSELWCPFPEAIHPAAMNVQQATTRWAQKFGLLRTRQDCERFERGQYGILMARAYPTARQEDLQLIADWNTWTFLLDDQFDEHTVGYDPNGLEQLARRILATLRGAAPSPSDSATFHALHDIACRLRARRDEAWMERFTACVAASLAAGHWESENRVVGRMPTEQEYRHMRLFTSGVFCYLALIELATQITLPDAIVHHPAVQYLANTTNRVICWSNDLFSFLKEVARRDVHNLIIILQHERQLSFDDAVYEVTIAHDAEVEAFQLGRAQVPSFGVAQDCAVQSYIDGMQAWMRANMDWSLATGRYNA
jgi:5-epi-alpha-selinene synthase